MELEEDRAQAVPVAAGDELVDGPVGWTLLGGLLISVAVMAAGLVVLAVREGTGSAQVLPVDRVVPELMKGSASAPLDLGILFLFATPLVAVVAALLGFIRQHDRVFAAVAVLLLVIMAAGFGVALR